MKTKKCSNRACDTQIATDRSIHRCNACQAVINRKWRAKRLAEDPEGFRQRDRAHCKRDRNKLKAAFLKAYGGKCTCCGESEPSFLSVDHVNNDGKEHRAKLGGAGTVIYRDLRKRGWPKEYTILCYNCNYAKFRCGICPHQREAASPT